jgi:hypothetical protein
LFRSAPFASEKRPNNTGRRINLLVEEIDARVKPIISFHSLPAPFFCTFTAAPPDLSLFFSKKKKKKRNSTTKCFFFFKENIGVSGGIRHPSGPARDELSRRVRENRIK